MRRTDGRKVKQEKNLHGSRKMLLRYLYGGVAATLLGFLLLLRLRDKKQSKRGDARALDAMPPAATNSSGSADVIVVGAGVAGSALAYALGKAGRRVHVIERDLTQPHRIMGEFLQPGGYLKLVELGLGDCVEEIDAQRISNINIYRNGKYAKLTYPLEKYDSQVAAWSFHNGRFIQRMREKASSLSNVLMEEGTVSSLFEERGVVKGVSYKNKAGEQLHASAPLTIVCDGCFSNLRRALCSSKVEVPSSFCGLILENCKFAFPDNGLLILSDPSPILLYPISSTEVRCLVDIPGQEIPSIANGEMANYLKTRVVPQLPSELHDAFFAAVDKGNIKTMPNKTMPASPLLTPGALLLGDAFNMRHPLTGGGMTVALSDIVVLQNLLKPLHNLHDASSLCKYLESFYTIRKPFASTLNTLAGLLYKVFSSSTDPIRDIIQQSYFDYMRHGGTPMPLFSGLNSRPFGLVAHLFEFTAFGVGRLLLPFPSPKRMWIVARFISCAWGIIVPLIKAEGVWQMFFPATVPAYYRAPPPQ